MTNYLRPMPMTEYFDGPLLQEESQLDDIEYFRSYILPCLTLNKGYVSVRCTTPTDPNIESYSVLIKKEAYQKSLNDLEILAEACKKYTEYLPTEMSISSITSLDKHGGNVKYVTYSKTPSGEWNKVESHSYYIRTEESIRREKEADAILRKEAQIQKAEVREKQKKDRLTAFSLEMIEKM